MVNRQTNLLKGALRAAFKGGEAIMATYPRTVEVFLKADESPLTEADLAANHAIINVLSQTDIPVLSEESEAIPYQARKDWPYLWIVDPIDGTKEFINQNGEFTVNIALIHKQLPVLGVIYVPAKQQLYFAAEGLGSFRLDDISAYPEQTSIEELIKQAKALPFSTKRENYAVVASRSHLNLATYNFIQNLRKDHNKMEIVSRGSSLKFCMIAEGTADIYPRFESQMKEWDTAAGHAIARYANATVRLTERDEEPRYNKEDIRMCDFIVKRAE